MYVLIEYRHRDIIGIIPAQLMLPSVQGTSDHVSCALCCDQCLLLCLYSVIEACIYNTVINILPMHEVVNNRQKIPLSPAGKKHKDSLTKET